MDPQIGPVIGAHLGPGTVALAFRIEQIKRHRRSDRFLYPYFILYLMA